LPWDGVRESAIALSVALAYICCSKGIDFNQCNVITYGICSDGTKTIQRGGRAGRNPCDKALFLMIFEKWVNEIDVSEVPSEELDEDPDRPFDVSGKKYPTKMERTGIYSINMLQDTATCIRKMFADYLGDRSLDGSCLVSASMFAFTVVINSQHNIAFSFVTPCCCDRCEQFDFSQYFLGDIYTGNEPKQPKASIPPALKNRPMKQRGPLQILLRSWRSKTHKLDPLRAIRPQTWIIDDEKIRKLSSVLPNRIQIPSDIARLLGETEEWSVEWSFPIFAVVRQYDNPDLYTCPASPTPSTTSSTSEDDEPPAKRQKTCTTQVPPPPLTIRIPPRSTLADLTNTYKGGKVLRPLRPRQLASNL
jgi:hypothetical protein